MTTDPRHHRSYLFVPGDRPERVAKALASGADAVILDLEDAVAPGRKDVARGTLAALPVGPCPLLVRTNPVPTREGLSDLSAVLAAMEGGVPIAGLVLAKAEPAQVALVSALLDEARLEGARLGALIETCAGLEGAAAAARASPRVSFLMFGGADLSAELGVDLAWEPLLHARAQIVQAAAGAGVAAVEMPWIALDDAEGEAADTARSRALGFTARAAIHPRQVAGIHAAFAPSAAELAWARRMLDAFETARGGVALLDGRLVERPVAERARRLLARASRRDEARA